MQNIVDMSVVLHDMFQAGLAVANVCRLCSELELFTDETSK